MIDTPHFQRSEFLCPHCKQENMKQGIVDCLEILRVAFGHTIVITSGYRCPVHNAEVGGVPDSPHTRGSASDIACNSSPIKDLFKLAETIIPNCRIGINLHANFIHIDTETESPYIVKRWYYDENDKSHNMTDEYRIANL